MQMKRLIVVLWAGIILSGAAQAALIDRGGGMIYDTDLNITWLADANYAKTSGYDADGAMTWAAANTWASSLVYGGFSDWRLARNSSVNGASWNFSYSFAGTTDIGFNITSPNSELSYMYYDYVNLGTAAYTQHIWVQAHLLIFKTTSTGRRRLIFATHQVQLGILDLA